MKRPPVAPHVAAALDAAVQGKAARAAARAPAPHVAAAIGSGAQARPVRGPAPGAPAPHVAAALASALQRRAASGPAGKVAAHVSAALASSVQPSRPTGGASAGLAPHVAAALGAAAQPRAKAPFAPGRPPASRGGPAVAQRAVPADYDPDEEDDLGAAGAGGGLLAGMDSMSIFRAMPEHEWDTVRGTGAPVADGKHYWSSTQEYVQDYLAGGGRESTSSVLVRIPLAVTVREFLLAVGQEAGGLKANNFGNRDTWEAHFGEVRKQTGKKSRSPIEVKNDGGTLTISFRGPSEAARQLMGTPERVVLQEAEENE